jgi:redox-sensitive bicupin YhaK (pirin superfamily)
MIKPVKYILPASEIDMGGFKIKQALPTQNVSQVDPFLLLHHGKSQFSTLVPARHQGVDPHPHRGFSPITFVIEGEVVHRDSRGNKQVAKAGGVHWINAGLGLIHSERPSESLLQNGGFQEIVQLWINSPSKSKLSIPYYHHLADHDFETEFSEDQLIRSKKIRGLGESPLLIYWIVGLAKGHHTYNLPKDFNACLYVIKGSIILKGFGLVDSEHLVVFEANTDTDTIEIDFKTDGELLILSGLPLNEKVVQSGPYVMNSETEILEAMRDYQMGKMGILIEE